MMCAAVQFCPSKMDSTKTNPDWLDKYIQEENILLDCLKSNANTESELMDWGEDEDFAGQSGLDALDNLHEILASMCKADYMEKENLDIQNGEVNKRHGSKNGRTIKCVSQYGKEGIVEKPCNRFRSHSSAGVSEVLRSQTTPDVNTESRRKSRRVSLGVRPRFSNWSRVKDAFKRDKSTGRQDTKEMEYPESYYSGDDVRIEPNSSSSHENTTQVSSSEEEYDYYHHQSFQSDYGEENYLDDYGHSDYLENSLLEVSDPLPSPKALSKNKGKEFKKSFTWHRTKSVPTSDNADNSFVSPADSPMKIAHFLYDPETIVSMTEENDNNNLRRRSLMPQHYESDLKEVEEKYEHLQQQLTLEFQEKCKDWKKMKNEDCRIPPSNYSDYVDISALANISEPKLATYFGEQNFSPSFRRKFEEWQALKTCSSSNDGLKTDTNGSIKKSKSDWHKWRRGSKSESNVIRYLEDKGQDNMEEVEQLNNRPSDREHVILTYPSKIKKQSIDILKGRGNNEKKELAWLDKELHKVAREKMRLEKEKEKFAERETRLQNMKKAIKSGKKSKQEVLVPTSTGLFRFQGISSKFTRKLYEWEKARGISAESSTFAFLDPNYNNRPNTQRNLSVADMLASLSRSRSVGSVDVTGLTSSVPINHQQSSLSLNDMEHLEEAHLQDNDELMDTTMQLFQRNTTDNLNHIDTFHNILQSDDINSLKSGNARSSIDCGVTIDNTMPEGSNESPPKTTKEDAAHISKLIKKLQAGTSVDDEDRIKTLGDLQQLSDDLITMVNQINSPDGKNDDVTSKISKLAVQLKEAIENLSDVPIPHHRTTKEPLHAKLKNDNNYSDAEDSSPIVHCTFVLPARRMNDCTTPSSTESESSARNYKRRITGRGYEHNADENYDGEDETTVYVNLRNKNKMRKIPSTDDENDETKSPNDESKSPKLGAGGQKRKCPKCNKRIIKSRKIQTNINNNNNNYCNCNNNNNKKDNENEGEKEQQIEEKSIGKISRCKIYDFNKNEKQDEKYFKNISDIIIPTTRRIYAPLINEDDNSINNKDNNKKDNLENNDNTKENIKEPKINNCNNEKNKINTENKKIINNMKIITEDNNENKDKQIKSIKDTNKCEIKINNNNNNNNENKKINKSKNRDNECSIKIIEDNDENRKEENNEKIMDKDKEIKMNYMLPPPCWILQEVRSKSASPSVIRRGDILKNNNNYKNENGFQNLYSESPSRERKKQLNRKKENIEEENNTKKPNNNNNNKLPPTSPSMNKKIKDNSIKLMIDHYNKLMNEKPQKQADGYWSPTIQRSPVLQRTAHFEHEIKKSKSAILSKNNQGSGISKSSSAGSIKYPIITKELNIGEPEESPAIEMQDNKEENKIEKNDSFENILNETRLRNIKIREARDRFFNEGQEINKKEDERKDTEEEEEDEERVNNSYEYTHSNLNKSISTGAIDERQRKNSLPTGEKSTTKSKFGLSSIASKFRKVKMRRHKEHDLGAVSSLCRASLLINFGKQKRNDKFSNCSKSCPSSPVLHRITSKRNSSSN